MRVAHHKSNKDEHDQHEKNVTDWPNLQNHFVYEDLEPNQAIQPAINHFSSVFALEDLEIEREDCVTRISSRISPLFFLHSYL